MTDWVEIYGPKLVRPAPAEWRREIKCWGQEAIPQEERGYISGTATFTVLEQVVRPERFRQISIASLSGWQGLESTLVGGASSECIAQTLVNFALAQPEWIFLFESASRPNIISSSRQGRSIQELVAEALL
jgi:hypothetical protein